jgi:hypothetical protein
MLVETGADVVFSNHSPPDLADLMPRIAPRHLLLIRALRGNEDETRPCSGERRRPEASAATG